MEVFAAPSEVSQSTQFVIETLLWRKWEMEHSPKGHF